MSSAFLADVERYRRSDRSKGCIETVRAVVRNYGLHALIAYRLGRLLVDPRRAWHLWLFWPIAWPAYFIRSSYVRLLYDIRLALSADIGLGLHISHFGGISVRECRLGKHCSIAQQVQISSEDGKNGPDIGDRVWIGAHCKVEGHFRIGSESTLSA